MARKTLLTESEIRQFMKLANLEPLGDAKINEMYGETEEITEDDEIEEGRGGDDDDDLDEGRGDKKDDDLDEGRGGKVMDRDEDELDEMGAQRGAYDRDEDEMTDDAEMDMDAAADDMGDAEMDMDAAADDMDMGGMDDAAREEVMADVVRAVAQALGIEDQVSVEAGEDDGMEGGDMDAMPEPALDDEPAEPEMAMGTEDDEEDIDMMAEDNEDELVAEVARRVAARLQTQNRKEQTIDALAERIMKRLTK